MSLKQAAIDAGYSESYADSGQIAKGKTWEEVMEEFFPDAEIAKIHQDQLRAEDIKQINFHYKVKDDELDQILSAKGLKLLGTKRFMTSAIAYVLVPDRFARDKALDKVYKLKKRYDNTIHIKGAIAQLSDEQLENEIAGILSEAFTTLAGETPEGTESEG